MRTFIAVLALASASAALAGPPEASFDTGKIEELTGSKGVFNEMEGVFKVSVPRSDLAVVAAGVRLTPPMGLTSWAAFAGGDDRAVVDGDFAMLESELQGVLKALRGAGINVVAIHQHMAGESPRIIFLHYWGVGRTEELAKGLRSALDRTGNSRKAPR